MRASPSDVAGVWAAGCDIVDDRVQTAWRHSLASHWTLRTAHLSAGSIRTRRKGQHQRMRCPGLSPRKRPPARTAIMRVPTWRRPGRGWVACRLASLSSSAPRSTATSDRGGWFSGRRRERVLQRERRWFWAQRQARPRRAGRAPEPRLPAASATGEADRGDPLSRASAAAEAAETDRACSTELDQRAEPKRASLATSPGKTPGHENGRAECRRGRFRLQSWMLFRAS